MLTRKQHELLIFINERITETGISPSFDEMKEALELRSKSGIHRLITALEEREFIRRLPHRARALEVLRLPDEASTTTAPRTRQPFSPSVVEGAFSNAAKAERQKGKMSLSKSDMPNGESGGDYEAIPVLGRIAAGTPIEAIQHEVDRFTVPAAMLQGGEHYVLEVQGESMIDAGIHDGDMAVIKRCDDATTGDIIVALVDEQEATLKRLRKKGGTIALEAANEAFETRIYGPDRVNVQGKLVGLVRIY